MIWLVSAFAPAAVGPPRAGRASCRLSFLEKRRQMRLIISKSVLIHQPGTPQSYASSFGSACVRCLISWFYIDSSASTALRSLAFRQCSSLAAFRGNRQSCTGQVSQRHFPIVSDGYIYIGIHSVSHGSSCFLILTGLPTNINVLRFYHIAPYQADSLRPVAFASSGIPNFSRQSFSGFSTFSSKWRFWRAMPGGPHVGGLPPRWAHSC